MFDQARALGRIRSFPDSGLERGDGWLRDITDEASAAQAVELGHDYQPLIDAVAALCPFQDVDADVAAVQEIATQSAVQFSSTVP